MHVRGPARASQHRGRSVRNRIFGAAALSVVVATLISVVIAGALVRGLVEDRVLDSLSLRADAVQQALNQPHDPDLEQGLFEFLREQREFLGLPGLSGPAAALRDEILGAAGERTVGTAEVESLGEVVFVVRSTFDGRFVLAREAGLGIDDWRPFLGVLLLAGAGGALLAAVPSYLLAGRIARPLAEVGAAGRRFAQGDAAARAPVGDLVVGREPVDLAAVAAEAQLRHADLARDLGIDVTWRAVPGSTAAADRRGIVQVVSHLVENALRATPSGGAVAIEASPGGLTVRTTGPGLAPEAVTEGFELFPLDDVEGPDHQGGGLAMAKALAEAMGGTVSVTSEPGRGTAFTVRLPPAPAAAPDAGALPWGPDHQAPQPPAAGA